MNVQPLDAGHIAKHTAQDFATLASEQGATLRYRCADNLTVSADPDRLRQALAALIDNALRHSHVDVTIEVEAFADGDEVVLAVSDNGPGIGNAAAVELFQRFRRGRSRSEGSGLGLPVVRALAEAHGGRATIENRTEGGARASVRLPRATYARPALQPQLGVT